ncbi:MAG: NAD-glutamate dehydrogenase [Pseudomonadota bacterium]
MSPSDTARKGEIVEEVAGLARRRLGPDERAAAEGFLRRFYANVALDDLAARPAEDLYGAALALWRFARRRAPGQPLVRVYNPLVAEHGWASRHTVVEIVNDDMPFLVDSVTAELNRRDLAVHLVIHPVMRVKRAQAGELSGLAEDGRPESFMHIEIDEQGAGEALAEIGRGIESVLADVRVAVADWRPMRKRLDDIIAELDAKPPPVPAEEIAAARGFLAWISGENFTLLGCREYNFGGADGEARANIVTGRGLGLCRDDGFVIFDGLRNLGALPPDVQDFVRRPQLLRVTKANRRSSVHRRVYLDAVGVKTFDAAGRVSGERLLVGLFTSTAYTARPRDIPLLAGKIEHILGLAGFDPAGHDGKALVHILETFPRDELFQATADELYGAALGVLALQERQRTALFVRRDPFERFISALVYVPRDRFNTDLRIRFHRILADAYEGRITAFYVQFSDESLLARVHYIVGTTPGRVPEVAVKDLERRLIEAGRSFADKLKDALVGTLGEGRGLATLARYADAFPAAYRDSFSPEAALADIALVERVHSGAEALGVNLYRALDSPEAELRLRVFHSGRPLPLSDMLPMIENMGLRVISEQPFRIAPAGVAEPVFMYDFAMLMRDAAAIDLTQVKPEFEAALKSVWAGAAENDGFNRLVIGAGLSGGEVTALRAYAKYLRQIGIPFSQAYMEDTLARHPMIARALVDLFRLLHDPSAPASAEAAGAARAGEIERLLDAVANLDEDRILRRFLNLVRATLRTNFFQRDKDGAPKRHLSLKLDSQAIDELPLPRPLAEIFVYAPEVEAVHLRGGRVARGGIRWSDRREDFRTEILGLMKAQQVKNVVIVPVGSKGGFFVKRPPPPEAGREAALAEGIACYKTMMRGLLDLTDSIGPGGVVPPQGVVRRDGDDPYLVVAADKGTATFSDIANAVAREYGFWLDDAFASGGSAGYDHKRMAITARGAWEAVKRHFRELGIDVEASDFTAVGVGDMSGDVFGNAMLRSRRIRLIGAFDHRHVFFDPDPDPALSFAERERLFNLPRSSWADYDAKLISAGGGVFERKAKSIKLSPEVRARFELAAEQATPADVVKAMLRARVDLLWLGGIGTFVKAAHESHAEVGDRGNDGLRVDGRELRARVVGEGANLGFTQNGRIEYAMAGGEGVGGRINTDAIDNSAGVDTSDHEVNIKILLGDIVARGDMTMKQRDELLARMTDEVAALVLRDNYRQTQALSLVQAQGAAALDRHVRLIRRLERAGRLNRGLEFLPDDEEIARRQAAGKGLTRPELAILLAYAKMSLYDELLASDLPDDPTLADDLKNYFPAPLRTRHKDAIHRHRLRREIIATAVTNSVVNRAGPSFVGDVAERTGSPAAAVARAYLAARQVFDLRRLWAAIEGLDNRVAAAVQTQMLLAALSLLERATLWFLRHFAVAGAAGIDIAASLARFKPGVDALRPALERVLDRARAAALAERAGRIANDGVPADLAAEMAGLDDLAAAPDLVSIAERLAAGQPGPVEAVAKVYFALGARLGFDWLREVAGRIKAETAWQKRALEAVVDDLLGQQAELAAHAIAAAGGDPAGADGAWLGRHVAGLLRIDALIAELKAAPAVDLAALTVASRELRALVAG